MPIRGNPCVGCGTLLPAEAPEGLCPRCVLAGGLGILEGQSSQHPGNGVTELSVPSTPFTGTRLRYFGDYELDLPSRIKLKEFGRPAGALGPLTFAPDGKTLVGGDIDGNLHFLNVAAGNVITTLTPHIASCRSISFSPDGRWLATAEVVDAVKLWPAPGFEETDRER